MSEAQQGLAEATEGMTSVTSQTYVSACPCTRTSGYPNGVTGSEGQTEGRFVLQTFSHRDTHTTGVLQAVDCAACIC